MHDDLQLYSPRPGVPAPRRRIALPALPRPEPLDPPVVDPDLPWNPPVERSAEVLRYSALRLEYGLSPGGGLRAWVKLMLVVFVAAAVPILLFTPLLVFLAAGMADVSAELSLVAANIMKAGFSLFVIAVLAALVFLAVSRR